MIHPIKIKSALISVYNKDHIEPLIRQLHQLDVVLYSTGGTEKFIQNLGIDVIAIEDLSGYPSILGGRVKTLHPQIFGGILARRHHEEDQEEISRHEIPAIDLVIVDLYPFEETVKSGASEADCIEKIDIGGVALIRASAKNYNDVVVIASQDEYQPLETLLASTNGATSLSDRKNFAHKAFYITSHYDTSIFNYFNQTSTPLIINKQYASTLRYGENPHQKGQFYGQLNELFETLNGKELSYNNLVDIDAAIDLIDEFDEPTCVILKHTNACGLASRPSLFEAWTAALACDPISAFGGVLVCNQEVDENTANEMDKLFFEVLIAPSFSKEALSTLCSKKNRILLRRKNISLPTKQFKSILNGMIEQDKDLKTETADQIKTVTKREANAAELNDLLFANKIVKHSKSNAIVLAKNNTLISSGVGQTSRVSALEQAIAKARALGFDLNGCVMASDAFFPFPDCVEIAADAGITLIIQPGGSIKDQASIDMANQKNVGMLITGIRHFKH